MNEKRTQQSAALVEAEPTLSDAERAAQALAAADLIDVDLRNAKALGRELFRLTNPLNGKQLVNWEAREHIGVTLTAFADDIDTPVKVAKLTILKLKQKGLSVPENLYRKAGEVKLQGQEELALEYQWRSHEPPCPMADRDRWKAASGT
jgi:hypothetical protein